jgi:predicted nucleic acid-binding protein
MPDMVFDTGVIQRLHRGGAFDAMKLLYGTIVVPRTVAEELDAGRAAELALPNLSTMGWVQVRDVRDPAMVSVVTGLGPGERAALALTMETSGSVLVSDEPLARRQAKMLRLKSTGSIGLLLKAKQAGHIPRLAPVLDLLDSRGFRFLPQARQAVLAWAAESR